MAGSLRTLLQDVLHALNARAPDARDRADFGDPRPLSNLLASTLGEFAASVLADPGARMDLDGEAPDLAPAWFGWLDADLAREAQWRARVAVSQRTFGEIEVDIADLSAALADEDPARCDAAWKTSEEFWRAPIDALTWLEARSERNEAETRPEVTTSSGIVLPDAAMVAAVLTGQSLENVDASREEANEDGPRLPDLMPVIEVARALCEAVETPPTSWMRWQFAIQGSGRDFRGPAGLPSGRLPFPRPLVPFARGGRRARTDGHTAREMILRHLVDEPALVGASVSESYMRHVLDASRSDAVDWIRRAALAVAGLTIESVLSELHSGDAEGLQTSTRWIAGSEAPRWWATLASRGPLAAELPGESSSLYVHSGAVWRRIRGGMQENLRRRERFDEDWFRDDRVVDAQAPRNSDVDGGLREVAEFLREQAQL